MAKTASFLDNYKDYEMNIGIEVHVQLNTNSKIFCSCPNSITKEQNSHICQICSGYPGVLPVLNEQVVNSAILAGLATNSSIAPISEFARKHYFYPDLPKSYQITQADKPICSNGHITIRTEDGGFKKIRLMRIHIEEDAGKNIHAGSSKESFVDLNRAGTPLLEIVTYPDISSTYEAKAYLKALRSIVLYLNISSGNMEEGAFRADTNISFRKKGAQELGTRAELKNINSFKFIGDAIEYEIERQISILEEGGRVAQETRLWDTKNKETVLMRSKEEAADYRYFPDPDLPLVKVTDQWIERLRGVLPELPDQKFDRLCKQLGLSAYEADILVNDVELAKYFEDTHALHPSKSIINWVLRDVMGSLNEHSISLSEFKVTPAKLAALIALLEKGVINNRAAQEVFKIIAQTGQEPEVVVKEKRLEQVGDSGELEKIIKEIVAAAPDQVAEYKAGKEKVFSFFVGQAMKKTQGKGNPAVIQELLKKYLA